MKKKSEKKQNVEIMVPGTINSKGESREKCGQSPFRNVMGTDHIKLHVPI